MAFDKNKSRDEKKEFEESVIHISRVSKTVKGGKNILLSFFDALSDSIRYFGALTDALAYAALTVADNDES